MHSIAFTNDICGEGAVWHPEEASVYWTDINRCLLHRYTLGNSNVNTWQFDERVTAVALTEDPERLVIVLGGQIFYGIPDPVIVPPFYFNFSCGQPFDVTMHVWGLTAHFG